MKSTKIWFLIVFSAAMFTDPHPLFPQSLPPTAELMDAVIAGNLDYARTAVAKGADVNSSDNNGLTPLMLSALYGHRVLAQYLIENRADVNAQESRRGQSALFFAAAEGHMEIVKLLLSNGAKVNLTVPPGSFSPLSIALIKGKRDIALFLIDAGADPDIPDKDGMTLLMATISGNEFRIARRLIEKSDSLNAQDSEGKNATMYAAEKGYVEIFVDLISKGCDPNLEDRNGRTALMYAAAAYNGSKYTAYLPSDPDMKIRADHVALVEYAIANGADVGKKDKKGKTALDYAKGSKLHDGRMIASLLAAEKHR